MRTQDYSNMTLMVPKGGLYIDWKNGHNFLIEPHVDLHGHQ